MTNKTGAVTATFDKEGKKGYRIRGDNQEENWYLLNKDIEKYYNPKLKNKLVEFNFTVEKEGKREIFILNYIKEYGVGEVMKQTPFEDPKPTQTPQQTYSHTQTEMSDVEREGRREVAISLADRRYQGLVIALNYRELLNKPYLTIKELVEESKIIEEYIKSGTFLM